MSILEQKEKQQKQGQGTPDNTPPNEWPRRTNEEQKKTEKTEKMTLQGTKLLNYPQPKNNFYSITISFLDE